MTLKRVGRLALLVLLSTTPARFSFSGSAGAPARKSRGTHIIGAITMFAGLLWGTVLLFQKDADHE